MGEIEAFYQKTKKEGNKSCLTSQYCGQEMRSINNTAFLKILTVIIVLELRYCHRIKTCRFSGGAT